MRLAIDADLIGKNRSGNEVYLRGIISGLRTVMDSSLDTIVLLGSDETALAGIETAPVPREILLTPKGALGDLTMGLLLRACRADGVIASYNAPLFFDGIVGTIVHDTAYLVVPETFPVLLRTRIHASVARSLRVSDFIITISNFSRQGIIDHYHVDPKKIIVAQGAPGAGFRLGDSDDEMLARFHLPEEFVLSVGNLQPRKNIVRLVKALRDSNIPLILVGQEGWRSADIMSELASVKWLGHVSVEELAGLYSRCSVFVYPSLFEGFGLPIVEAMACGAPVVASGVRAILETAGGAALFCDPLSEDDIRFKTEAVLNETSLRSWLVAAGSARAAELSWERSARATYERFSAELAKDC